MGRKSVIGEFLNRQVGGILILKDLGLNILTGRKEVECQCVPCGRMFKATFHNVYKGSYKSCGCVQFKTNKKNPRWKGCGDISGSIIFGLKRGAKSRGLEFSVSPEYLWDLFLEQRERCAYTGRQLTFPKNRLDHEQNASLDRIDSAMGYVEGNLQWIDKDINYMKQSMSDEIFLNTIKEIYEHCH